MHDGGITPSGKNGVGVAYPAVDIIWIWCWSDFTYLMTSSSVEALSVLLHLGVSCCKVLSLSLILSRRLCSAAFPEQDLLRPLLDRPRRHSAAPSAARLVVGASAEAILRCPPVPQLVLGIMVFRPSDLVVVIVAVAALRGSRSSEASCSKTWQSHDAISASLAIGFPQGRGDDGGSGRGR